MASLKVMPPAISGGLMVFMTILFFVGVAVPGFNDSLKLQKSTFSNFEREYDYHDIKPQGTTY